MSFKKFNEKVFVGLKRLLVPLPDPEPYIPPPSFRYPPPGEQPAAEMSSHFPLKTEGLAGKQFHKYQRQNKKVEIELEIPLYDFTQPDKQYSTPDGLKEEYRVLYQPLFWTQEKYPFIPKQPYPIKREDTIAVGFDYTGETT